MKRTLKIFFQLNEIKFNKIFKLKDVYDEVFCKIFFYPISKNPAEFQAIYDIWLPLAMIDSVWSQGCYNCVSVFTASTPTSFYF